jgi:E3 ubiquitin-protein ligase UHRF1
MNVRDHERIRRENIQKNKELLLSLGLDKPAFEPKQKKLAPAAPKPKPALKRNASDATSDSEDEEDKRPKKKVQRATKTAVNDEDGASADAGPRRSGRNAGKTIDYNSESLATSRMIVEPVSVKARRESNYGGGPEGRSIGKRIHDP